jgi:MATE family multidrug resistance protein
VAVGANYVGIFHFAAIGLLMALSPLVAHAYGARRHHVIGSYVRQGLWLAAALSVVLIAALLAARPVLSFIGVPRDTALLASRYVAAFAFGVPALCGFYALRFGSEGIGWTRPVMYTAVVGLIVNVVLNWILMYGLLGMPALGAVGTGLASAITWWLLFAILWIYVKRHAVYQPFAPLQRREAPSPAGLREITRLGAPIAGSLVLEGGMFNAAALMLASFGAAVIAAHAIAINFAALMFMIPLSLNSATTIHVGHLLGAGDARGARLAAYTGVGLGVGVMALSALVMVLASERIAGLYTRDVEVAALAATLLLYAAAFQVADGVQVCTAGALRGYKDTRIPMVVNLVAYWGIGFPLAWWFGVTQSRGAPGVWIGLIAGLFVAAVLLQWRLLRIARAA